MGKTKRALLFGLAAVGIGFLSALATRTALDVTVVDEPTVECVPILDEAP